MHNKFHNSFADAIITCNAGANQNERSWLHLSSCSQDHHIFLELMTFAHVYTHCNRSHYLAHLEPIPQLAFVASISAPPSNRHASLEGCCQLSLLGAQFPHVIQIGTQASRRPRATISWALPQLHGHLPALECSQGLNDLTGL